MTTQTRPVVHGVNRYTNHGCRCAVCREAMRVYQAEYRARTEPPRRVRDPIAAMLQRNGGGSMKLGLHCPRCETGLLAEDATGPFCLREQACGWRWSYPPGTTHRADGSALEEAANG